MKISKQTTAACESAAKRSCANCPHSRLSSVVPSSSATNAVASPAANAPTAPVMAQVLSVGKLSRPAPANGLRPQESYAQASEFLDNYHHARQILEEICEINRELLRRREKL